MSQPLPFLLSQSAVLFGAEEASGQMLQADGVLSVTGWEPNFGGSIPAVVADANDDLWALGFGAAAALEMTLSDPSPSLSSITTGTLHVRVRRTS